MSPCAGIKADGGRCGAQAIKGNQWCFSHHPDFEEQRRRRASKGGKRGGRGRPVVEVQAVKLRAREQLELEGRVGRLLSRLERLERRRLLGAIAETHRRLGKVLDGLSDQDMARLILAVTEAFRPVEGDLDAESQAFAGVFGAAPAAVVGLSDAAKEGVEAWRAAGGCEAWTFGMAALGDATTDKELARAVGEARTRFRKPEFHKARARPYLRGLPWGG